MKKQEFINKYFWVSMGEATKDLESVIQDSIEAHEAAQWKAYPYNANELVLFKKYLWSTKHANVIEMPYNPQNIAFVQIAVNFLAFRELPSPFNPETK